MSSVTSVLQRKPAGMSWWFFVRKGIGTRLTRAGERLGVNWLIYNPWIFLTFHQIATENAPAVLDAFEEVFPHCSTLVDVGAGSGAYAAHAASVGYQVVALENSPTGRRMARRQGVEARPFDLTRSPAADLDAKADLAYCFEVAEHLPEALGDRLVTFLSGCAKTVAFTAAAPGQGGQGHVNEQPKRYWIARFEAAGMEHDASAGARLRESFRTHGVTTAWFLIENIMVFRQAPAHPDRGAHRPGSR
jgi:SAM-dependent methyltransferase